MLKNPHKTKAGEITTEFIKDVFYYGLNVERDGEFIKKLYEQSASKLENSKVKEL